MTLFPYPEGVTVSGDLCILFMVSLSGGCSSAGLGMPVWCVLRFAIWVERDDAGECQKGCQSQAMANFKLPTNFTPDILWNRIHNSSVSGVRSRKTNLVVRVLVLRSLLNLSWSDRKNTCWEGVAADPRCRRMWRSLTSCTSRRSTHVPWTTKRVRGRRREGWSPSRPGPTSRGGAEWCQIV